MALAQDNKEEVLPLYYVRDMWIYQRPVRTHDAKTKSDRITMGFRVCKVCEGVDPAEVCAILNKGEPATEG